MSGMWFSFQLLVPTEQVRQFDLQMYHCAVSVYSEIQRIVAFQCVSDFWAPQVLALLSQPVKLCAELLLCV